MNTLTHVLPRRPVRTAPLLAATLAAILAGAACPDNPPASQGVTALVNIVEHWPAENLTISYTLAESLSEDGTPRYDLSGTVVSSPSIPAGSPIRLSNIGVDQRAELRRVSAQQSRLQLDGATLGVLSVQSQQPNVVTIATTGSPSRTVRFTTDLAAWALLDTDAPTLPTVIALLLEQGEDPQVPTVGCDPTRRQAMQDALDACTHGVKAFSWHCDRTTGSVSYSFECQPNPAPTP